MSIKPRIFLLLFILLASSRLFADDAEYDEMENRPRNGFFGISDRPAPMPQNQQGYQGSYDQNSMMNFLVPMQQQSTQQPVVVDENYIYENADDEYILYGIQD